MLALQVGSSPSTLRRRFHEYLDVPPSIHKAEELTDIYLKVDATHFKKYGCLIVCKAGSRIIYYSWHASENLVAYLEIFNRLKYMGYRVKAVTSDKHGSIVSAVKLSFQDIPHQYCTVHIQRLCTSLITRNPQTEAGVKLKEIVSKVNRIQGKHEKEEWQKQFRQFAHDYMDIMKQRTYMRREDGTKTWWYTHKNLRHAFIFLRNSESNMFFYLEDGNLPKDTNGLEAEFTHLKSKLRIHRGLKRERRINFLYWYFCFKTEG